MEETLWRKSITSLPKRLHSLPRLPAVSASYSNLGSPLLYLVRCPLLQLCPSQWKFIAKPLSYSGRALTTPVLYSLQTIMRHQGMCTSMVLNWSIVHCGYIVSFLSRLYLLPWTILSSPYPANISFLIFLRCTAVWYRSDIPTSFDWMRNSHVVLCNDD